MRCLGISILEVLSSAHTGLQGIGEQKPRLLAAVISNFFDTILGLNTHLNCFPFLNFVNMFNTEFNFQNTFKQESRKIANTYFLPKRIKQDYSCYYNILQLFIVWQFGMSLSKLQGKVATHFEEVV